MRRVFLGTMLGFGLVYFLDPSQGSKRRGRVARLAGQSSVQPEPYRPSSPPPPPTQTVAPSSASTPPPPPKAAGAPKGESAQADRPQTRPTAKEGGSAKAHDNEDPDDNTLRDRIESELFANTEYGREHLNINVVEGVVEIRGELPTQGEIDDIVRQVSAIRNVKDVRSFLHVPGTPAPNKESALESS